MENQVQALLKQNVPAALLNSSITQAERKRVGKLLVYCSR